MNHQSFSRRTFLRGVGVSMALPWMESLRVWGDEAKAVRGASEAPVRLAVLFSGNGFHTRNGGRAGAAASMELGQVLAPLADFRERMLFIRGLYNAEAQKGQHPQLADGQPAFGRPSGLGRRDPLGNELRPAPGASPRQVDQGAEPGARLREVEPVGAQELFDALQLAHFVDFADDADAARALPRPGLRSAVPRRGEARRQERARRRAVRRTRLPPRGQRWPISASWTNIWTRCARSKSGSSGPASGASCRAGGPPSNSPTFRARPTEFLKTSASTCD